MISRIAEIFQEKIGNRVQPDCHLRLPLHGSNRTKLQEAERNICPVANFLEKGKTLLDEVNGSLTVALKPGQYRQTHERIRNTPLITLRALEREAFFVQLLCFFIIPTSSRCLCQVIK